MINKLEFVKLERYLESLNNLYLDDIGWIGKFYNKATYDAIIALFWIDTPYRCHVAVSRKDDNLFVNGIPSNHPKDDILKCLKNPSRSLTFSPIAAFIRDTNNYLDNL